MKSVLQSAEVLNQAINKHLDASKSIQQLISFFKKIPENRTSEEQKHVMPFFQ